uniref:Putative flavoprotein involved in K+ transport n=1 Tax=Candidatus Kentrum sp. LFY TaxID=2126342 RepID=A0A450UG02_9GAMM|nr:MAG: putative flavoprotein involved in K+ transport [Candidatus Kentron sp. LFY]
MELLDCIVIGGGQSGLYTAKCLAEKNLEYLLLERNRVGDVWRNRLANMKLFTSRQFCALPGMAFDGDPGGFSSVGEVADYLESYAQGFDLNIRDATEVVSVTRHGENFMVATADGVEFTARSIVNATGSNQVCIVPEIANRLSDEVVQYTADTHEFDRVPEGCRVVVVGDGASGRQIAALLNGRGEKVTLSTGTSRGLPPNTVFGRDIFWWLKKLGILFADRNSIVAKILRKRNPVPCGEFNNKRLRKRGIRIRGATLSCSGNELRFECGHSEKADVVVWAVGYRDNVDWLKIDKCVAEGEFIQEYGVTPEPGLFVVGRKWQSCRASELIMGVERDVRMVVDKLSRYLEVGN